MENGEEEGRYEPMAPVKKGRRERARLFERSLLLLRLLAEGEEAQGAAGGRCRRRARAAPPCAAPCDEAEKWGADGGAPAVQR
eukprot:scaffold9023_cov24-Tisochrysis_lutea.AAC.3